MSSSTEKFYESLPHFTSEMDIFNEQVYLKLPPDWCVIICDVKNSSSLVDEGLYKNVNVISVAAIISVRNACKDIEIPYVFGGDGAHIFTPVSKIDDVRDTLSLTKMRAAEEFNIELRTSLIPMNTILSQGGEIYISKMKLSNSAHLAMARGSGLEIAESIAKNSDQFEVKPLRSPTYNAYDGFECKWDAIQAKRDGYLSLIIHTNNNQFQLYREITHHIHDIAPHLSFVETNKLNIRYAAKNYFKEIKIKYGGFKKYLIFLWNIPGLIYENLKSSVTKKSFVSLPDLMTNTDHIKFDNSLFMVVDVTQDQKDKILFYLDELQNQKAILYGYHVNKEALLTCFVKSKDNHIHFVDGGSGGYTQAAKMLKAIKLKNDKKSNAA